VHNKKTYNAPTSPAFRDFEGGRGPTVAKEIS